MESRLARIVRVSVSLGEKIFRIQDDLGATDATHFESAFLIFIYLHGK